MQTGSAPSVAKGQDPLRECPNIWDRLQPSSWAAVSSGKQVSWELYGLEVSHFSSSFATGLGIGLSGFF